MYKILFFITITLISCNSPKTEFLNEKSETNIIDSLIFDCYDDASQLEINICSLIELEYYDSILNNRYQKLMDILDSRLAEQSGYPDSFEYYETKAFKDAIISSQKIWIEFRDQNSEIQGMKYEGGTMENMARNNQMTQDTKDRIKLIEELLYDELE